MYSVSQVHALMPALRFLKMIFFYVTIVSVCDEANNDLSLFNMKLPIHEYRLPYPQMRIFSKLKGNWEHTDYCNLNCNDEEERNQIVPTRQCL